MNRVKKKRKIRVARRIQDERDMPSNCSDRRNSTESRSTSLGQIITPEKWLKNWTRQNSIRTILTVSFQNQVTLLLSLYWKFRPKRHWTVFLLFTKGAKVGYNISLYFKRFGFYWNRLHSNIVWEMPTWNINSMGNMENYSILPMFSPTTIISVNICSLKCK